MRQRLPVQKYWSFRYIPKLEQVLCFTDKQQCYVDGTRAKYGGDVKPPQYWSAGKGLWLRMQAAACQRWKGYFPNSFRGKMLAQRLQIPCCIRPSSRSAKGDFLVAFLRQSLLARHRHGKGKAYVAKRRQEQQRYRCCGGEWPVPKVVLAASAALSRRRATRKAFSASYGDESDSWTVK